MTGIPEIALAKHQTVANLSHRASFAHQLEVPTALGGVAVKNAADQAIILQHEFLVDPVRGIGQHDGVGGFIADEISGRK